MHVPVPVWVELREHKSAECLANGTRFIEKKTAEALVKKMIMGGKPCNE